MKATSTTTPKPLYKRSRFYFLLIVGITLFVILTLMISVISLRWINPPVTAFTLQYSWSDSNTDRYNLRDKWVPGDELPEHLKWAVVASEDQLFWDHNGFDMDSIKEAWEQRQSGERYRGASTISQQVAKNLYLSPAQSFFRKGIEAGITILIELFWSKERIIEVYLNIAEFGPGIFGIGTATETYWSIETASLSAERSARLAAVLPNPTRMRVEPPSPFTQERSQWILRQMTNLSGYIYTQTDRGNSTEEKEEDIDPMLLDTESNIEQELFNNSNHLPGKPDSIKNSDSIERTDSDMKLNPDSSINLLKPDTLSTQVNR